ncbi:MAG: hypothetical protein ACTHU0_30240 [Kofleriaceae bacterium]
MTEPRKPASSDRPRVPRPRFARVTLVFAAFGALVIGAYSAFAFTGRELGTPARDEVPASVRSSPGGYRSYHFWHSGYHGGK